MKQKLLRHIDIGGKEVRLLEDEGEKEEGFYYLYESKKLIYRFVKIYITKKTLWQVTTDYANYLKELQEKFEDEKLPEDKIINDVEREVRKELIKRLRNFFKDISQTGVKQEESFSEDFLGLKIFPKLNDVFSGFNKFVDKTVSSVMKKLKVEVVDDVDETGRETPTDVKKDVNNVANLMKRQVKDTITSTKDNMLKDIKRDLTQGIAANQSVSSIKREIEKKYNYKNGVGWKVERSVSSSLSYANMMMKFKKWLDMGFKRFEWITRDDSKVRPLHAKKNHRVYSIKKAMESNDWNSMPGKAANCRCSAIPYD